MEIDVEERLRRTLHEVGSRVQVSDSAPPVDTGTGPRAVAPLRRRWQPTAVAALVIVVLGVAAAALAFPRDDGGSTLVAGPDGAPAEVALDADGRTYRGAATTDDDEVCLEVEPSEGRLGSPPAPVCIPSDDPDALAVGAALLEDEAGTLVYAIGGPQVRSMAGAVDQVSVAQAANGGTADVAVFLMVADVFGATGTVEGLDAGGRMVASARFGDETDRIESLPPHVRRWVERWCEVRLGMGVEEVTDLMGPGEADGRSLRWSGWGYDFRVDLDPDGNVSELFGESTLPPSPSAPPDGSTTFRSDVGCGGSQLGD